MTPMAVALILLPVGMAAVALAVPSNRLRPWLLPVAGVGHVVLTGLTLAHPAPTGGAVWLLLDPPGLT